MSAPVSNSSGPLSMVTLKPLSMVTLKDGYQVPQSALITTMITLKSVHQECYVALFDLVQKCKDSNYKFVSNPFGDSKKVLREFALIDESEKVHDIVKHIVLNAVEGDGFSMRLVNPQN